MFTFAIIAFASATIGLFLGRHLRRGRFLGRPIHWPGYKGNALEQVREEVLTAIRAFQSGYTRRDIATIQAFMQQLFPKDQDILFLGSEAGEWTEGYPHVGDFIANDWRYYGDVRLDVDDAMVSANDDVAWVTTVGTVGPESSAHPIRFTAILTRNNARWLFRHIQFQWDEKPPRLAETAFVQNPVGMLLAKR